MRMRSVRAILLVGAVAGWVAACGITLETAPGDDGDAGGGTSTSSTGGNTASSSGSGPVDSGHDTGTTSSTSGSTGSTSGGVDACTPVDCTGKCGDIADPCAQDGFAHCGDTCAADNGNDSHWKCDGNLHACGCVQDQNACAGKACGTAPVGCGGADATCGSGNSCPNVGEDHFQCVGNACNACKSKAEACAGKCGQLPAGADGCGGTYDCGTASCAAPDTCGAVTANQCGCKPKTPAEAGCAAGSQSPCKFAQDGCGGYLDCGDCPGNKHCQYDNGNGSNNTCVNN